MKQNVENVLVLSPHTDDMELGAGATVRMLVESGANVKSVVFSDCKESVDTTKYPDDILRKECTAAASDLGIYDLTIYSYPVRKFPGIRQEILENIYRLRKETDFDLVLTPWKGDLHQDHRTVAKEALRAFMKTKSSIIAYPIPGNCPGFTPRFYVPVTPEKLQAKIDLLYKYESQVVRRHYFSTDAIKAWMGTFGIDIGVTYAEGFVQERSIARFV
ncbi:MAG: PIG-L deacetylase family protein [Candidatus Thorarchaeota archaeon]|jgi:LmbE family N-acetylglucosaminyl deacetylase